MKLKSKILFRIDSIILLIAFLCSFGPSLIPFVHHEHHNEHDSHHVEICADVNPCHRKIYHQEAEASHKCLHDSHVASRQTNCHFCHLYVDQLTVWTISFSGDLSTNSRIATIPILSALRIYPPHWDNVLLRGPPCC